MLNAPKKRFGQNFLQSQVVIDNILRELQPIPTDRLVEIGPGRGALTFELLKKQCKLTAIEIDRDLCAYLKSAPLAQNALTLVNQDALMVDYRDFGSSLRLIGNLPYNISTPLLIHVLRQIDAISDMHFMLQKEVVDRIVAEPGSKTYGRLSVMTQAYCEVDYLLDVPPSAFTPQPKVDSAVVRLVARENLPDIKFSALEKLVATAFAMRRKTLLNNLKKIVTANQLIDLGIDPSSRPEQISVEEYIRIIGVIHV